MTTLHTENVENSHFSLAEGPFCIKFYTKRVKGIINLSTDSRVPGGGRRAENEERVAAAARENVIAFVGKRAAKSPVYRGIGSGGGVTAKGVASTFTQRYTKGTRVLYFDARVVRAAKASTRRPCRGGVAVARDQHPPRSQSRFRHLPVRLRER